MESFDRIDRAIVYHLQANARASYTEIAEDLGIAPNTVKNRLTGLEESGAIEGYRAGVNYDVMGVHHYYIFSCTARPADRESLATEVSQHPGVVEVITLMTGRENVFIIGASNTKEAIYDLAVAIDDLGLRIEREHLIRTKHRRPFDGFRLDGR